MDFTKYTNDVDFVPRPDSDEGSAVINEWRESKKKHDERERELTRDFIIDALTELDILEHPMGYRAFQIAFQEKWISSGYPGVFFLLEEIAALLKGEPPPSDPPSSPR